MDDNQPAGTAASQDGVGWYSEEAATFGDRVTGAREALGLSEDALARKLGVKLKTVRAWEGDLAEPRANKLQMLAGILNVSIMWLLTGQGDGLHEPADDPVQESDLADLLVELRSVKAELGRASDRLGRLEKRLRRKLSAG